MNKLVRRIKRTTVKDKSKSKEPGTESSKMDVCFADDSSDSGLDVESRIQLLRRNSASSSTIDRASTDLDRDSSDDSIDSGIFGVSSADELNSSDASLNSDARVTLVEDTGLANLLCQSISINEDDNANEPPNKRRRVLSATLAITEKVSDMQIEMSGSTREINLYGIASQVDRPQLTAYRSSSNSKNSLTTNHSLNSRRKINRKPPSLHATYPSRVKDGQIDLRIISQPEEQHRARYMTEGSRGAIKDRRGSGFPTVKLFGYNQPVTLQVFIGSDQSKIQPHLFYQACKVSGKNCTPCTERVIDGTTVIEISMLPDKDMTVSCDCIGILKERNVDVEQRLPYFNMTRAKKKNTRCRMIFRVDLPVSELGVDTLQTASSPILCTQPPGVPEISKKSIKECSVTGGKELFIIGKNFLKDTKIIFEEETHNGGHEMNKTWQDVVEPEKEFLHQTHLVCRIPPYRRQDISEPVKVHLTVQSGGKTSEPHTFVYLPVKQGLNNVSGNFQTITSGIPGSLEIGQQLSRSHLMPAFIQVPAPLTTASVPTVVVSPSNFLAFPRGSVPDTTGKSTMNHKLVHSSTKMIKTLSKPSDENGCNPNQIHVVVLQQSEKNIKRTHHISPVNRFKSNSFPGKRLNKFIHKGKLVATSRGKLGTNHPYHSPVPTTTNAVFKQPLIGEVDQMSGNSVSGRQDGTITTAIIPQDVNTTTTGVQGFPTEMTQAFATEITPTTIQSADLFASASIISSVNEMEHHVHSQIQENQNLSANCLQTSLSPNGVPVQTMLDDPLVSLNEISIPNQTVIVGMQPLMSNGAGLLESQSTLIAPNELIQGNENILNQQNELMDQSIIINGDTNNSRSSPGKLMPNECQSIQLKQQLSDDGICLGISQNELLKIQSAPSGLCTIIDTKQLPNEGSIVPTESLQSAHALKQEIGSKEFLQAQPVIISSVLAMPGEEELRNSGMDQNLNEALKNELLTPISQSSNFIAIHTSERSETLLHAPRLPSEQILCLAANTPAENNSDSSLTLTPKAEPLLSQVAQMSSPNPVTVGLNCGTMIPPVTTCLQTSGNLQPLKFAVKQEKPNAEQPQCDMNIFQHTMTSALSMFVMASSCGERSCFLDTAEGSLRACINYLNELSVSGFVRCENDVSCERNAECPTSCAEIQTKGQKKSGVYKICVRPWFNLEPFDVYCDLEHQGGGWTVFQRRGNYGEQADHFIRNWTSYKNGFGNLSSQFWLGNDQLFALTNQDHVSLKIELQTLDDEIGWAEYNDFRIESEKLNYRMSQLGNYTGNAGDSLRIHQGQAFYTKDRDSRLHCARDRKGGWWYSNCHQANLNGLYVRNRPSQIKSTKSSAANFISWSSFGRYENFLKRSEMKIRPTYFG
uniref:Nuclear factor of activated T-cells 5 n=1 Tax=Strigamia maritima TaxID=126957 RepID=T1ISA8_STRMM